ncbi:hypothetical protein OIE66_09420 [Nonomuraea sp. NBC_01738]|uniref:hypothetical protein n=1 Tax=Nonomuraea sp. NBC_01738 TaxID=2976003 RepID=UPI002E13F9B4|nr:hypothetical protein OIE66_09420 [Nonomuraea sp. NBC_01738]
MSDDEPLRDPGANEEERAFRLAGLTSGTVGGKGAFGSVGDHATITQNFGVLARARRVVTLFGPKDLERLRNTVPTRSRKILTDRLAHEDILILFGRRNTGRKTAALSALHSWAGDGVRLGSLDPRTDLSEMAPNSLTKAKGYVFAPRDGDVRAIIPALRDMAVAAGCRIVVLASRKDADPRIEVEHDPPDSVEVFRALLEQEGRALDMITAASPPELADLLKRSSPGESAALALKVSQLLHQNIPIDEVLANVLLPSAARLVRTLREEPQLDRCLLISTGVLHGLSEVKVSQSAVRLDALIREQEHEARRSSPPSWEPLEALLDSTGVQTLQPETPGDPSRIALHPDEAELVLGTAWMEAPALRPVLCRWLDELTGTDDRQVAIRAAQSLRSLAAIDFDMVTTRFLNAWTDTVGHRLLARDMLEATAAAPDLAGRVHQLLTAWSGGSFNHRLAAAVAYGSTIGTRNIDGALTAFQKIVRGPGSSVLHNALAEAITEVYSPGTADRVLAELSAWADSGDLPVRRAAAVATLWLAHLPNGRPALTESDRIGDLAILWRNALNQAHGERRIPRSPMSQIWGLLPRWAEHPALEEAFRAAPPHLHGTLRFQLRLWQQRGRVGPERRATLTHALQEGLGP